MERQEDCETTEKQTFLNNFRRMSLQLHKKQVVEISDKENILSAPKYKEEGLATAFKECGKRLEKAQQANATPVTSDQRSTFFFVDSDNEAKLVEKVDKPCPCELSQIDLSIKIEAIEVTGVEQTECEQMSPKSMISRLKDKLARDKEDWFVEFGKYLASLPESVRSGESAMDEEWSQDSTRVLRTLFENGDFVQMFFIFNCGKLYEQEPSFMNLVKKLYSTFNEFRPHLQNLHTKFTEKGTCIQELASLIVAKSEGIASNRCIEGGCRKCKPDIDPVLIGGELDEHSDSKLASEYLGKRQKEERLWRDQAAQAAKSDSPKKGRGKEQSYQRKGNLD